MPNIQLSANLKRLRCDHDYTQEQIGRKLNISRQAYSNYERGIRVPDVDILIRIADIYQIPLEQLITQNCTGAGIINESSGPYFTGMIVESADTIYLSREELTLLTHYRNASEDDRRLTRKVLGISNPPESE
ncbi:helix-turn-helix domain-containing protein [Ruminococcus sp. CLA-AA-H200]|uniref:Helix-turn-helix domain-containing protein n=1 Tax=Ruminococcus turbiniformis TaxID=2881258 RepID=A0ABS8FUF4_9FIRM|nr:helix-turn-helix transcriptional regulator [Ruminococcus turbiniformis]MCC2253692.1 helix-turn-helix domain-containing protein [Ruminococcus turbiniformis]